MFEANTIQPIFPARPITWVKPILWMFREAVMALAFDEFGPPFFILREQEGKSRLRGLDAGKAVARIIRASLGPKGMDKILQSPGGDVTIGNRPTPLSALLTDLALAPLALRTECL